MISLPAYNYLKTNISGTVDSLKYTFSRNSISQLWTGYELGYS